MTGRAEEGASMMMRLLEQGVPLTLLLDLMSPPDAHELYVAERSEPSDEA